MLKLILVFWNLAKSWSKNYTDAALACVARGMTFKGAVNYYDDLPTEGVLVGDTYTVKYAGSSGTTPNGAEYVWGPIDDVNQWVYLGPDISVKADKVSSATANNLAALDANGNLIDAGCAASSKADLQDGKVPKAQIPLSVSVVQSTLTITY